MLRVQSTFPADSDRSRPPPGGHRRSPRRSATGRAACRRRRRRRARSSSTASSRHTLPRSVSARRDRSSSRLFSGPTNPIASSTRSAFISNSLPATGSKPTRPSLVTRVDAGAPCSARTRPVVVARESGRRHGVDADRRPLRARTRCGRCSATAATDCRRRARCGGVGSSSSCATDAAPWRCTVPRQSAPVSPPPMMIDVLAGGRDDRVASASRRPGSGDSAASGNPSRSGRRRARGRARRDRAAGRRRRRAAPRRSRAAGPSP